MLVLVGKTCTGKDTVMKELIDKGFEKIVTYTTRPSRPGESDGVTYHFISEEDFLEKENNGFFAETTSYDTVFGKWYYGSAREDYEGEDNIKKAIILNPSGLKQLFENEVKNVVSFELCAPNDVIRRRLLLRGDNPEEAERRIVADNNDFKSCYADYGILNTDDTPAEVADTIISLYLIDTEVD